MRCRRWRVGVALLLVACSDGDETLEPLPIDGATVAPAPGSSVAPPPPGSTTTTTTTTSLVAQPVGDWDGARFDVGTIETLTRVGSARAIGFDRYTFADPERGTIDAPAFDEEPLAAWWRTSPYSNVRVQTRTFVLDPGVEVLVLDDADRAQACAEPSPAQPPEPSWAPAELAILEDPAYVGAIATLTYSPTGQVTRIRFTGGC